MVPDRTTAAEFGRVGTPTRAPSRLVAVLIAGPGSNAVREELVDAAASRIAGLCPSGSDRIQKRCLGPGEAYEIEFDGCGIDPQTPAREVRSLADPPDFDIAVLPAEHRRKRLLLADMESTIIQQECLDELADYVGLRARVAAITARAMRGELDFTAAVRERVALLKGLNAEVLEEVYRQRVTLMPGAQTLTATMKAHGATCALVSGGFTFFAQRIAARLNFDVHYANRLDISAGRIAGTVGEPILGRDAKRAALRRLARAHRLRRNETMAVGDGANDIDMLKAAGLGVAFRARPTVAAQAAVAIVHGDLSALLYLQGYTRQEFVVH
jgi:phosphoserine phosphatase